MFIVAVVVFAFGLLVATPRLFSAVRSVKGDLRLIAVAWFSVFVGQGQMFQQQVDAYGTVGTSRAGEIYQLVWMIFGAALLSFALIKVTFRVNRGSFAITGLGMYALAGVASAVFSPAPFLSTYKSAQILLDVALVIVAISAASYANRPRVFLDLSYFLLLLVLFSAACGAVLLPDLAFQNIEEALTPVLHCVYPAVHANELGLLSAIMLVVGVRRALEVGTGPLRIYWGCAAVLAAVVLFNAQARTSLASAAISLTVLALFIPRLRLPAMVIAAVLGGWLASRWVNNDVHLSIKGTTAETYLRRGASDQAIATMSGRSDLWQIGWTMFKDAPILGHGMEAGVRLGGAAYGLPPGTNMHSAHMQILVNTGFVGYAMWLVFVLGVIRAIGSALTHSPGGMRTEEGRLRLELALVAFMILFRTFLGHVLVTHHFSFLVFLAIFVCAVSLGLTPGLRRSRGKG